MSKQWLLRENIPEEVSKELDSLVFTPPSGASLAKRLLFYRGIKTAKEAEEFLMPDYERDIGDPLEILNMDKAADRILKAVKENEKIVVFGDYDADGVCSSAIFHDFFKKINFDNFHVHIPDRNKGGYGLTDEAIDEFVKQKFNLVITLDCGITDYDEVEKLKAAGIETVIIDHHIAPEKLPPAFAVVDLKQGGDNYFFRELCGAGIAFKTVQALIKKGSANLPFQGEAGGGSAFPFKITPGWEKWLLDLVAIATVADMVPLNSENRTLVSYGLQVLRKTPRRGLIALCRRAGISLKDIVEDDIGFTLGPRINTASRMDHANTSFELVTTQNDGEADWISGRLEELNVERKKSVEKILSEVDEKNIDFGNAPIIVVGDEGWLPGVLGIAANRLMEKYNKPVFVWGKGEGKFVKGSCRSDGSVNLVEMMRSLPKEFMFDFGGHVLAGGFSAEKEKIDGMADALVIAYEKTPKQEKAGDCLQIDAELLIDDANWELHKTLEQFQPFGSGNLKPVFIFKNLEIANVKKFGNGGIHLQLDFKLQSSLPRAGSRGSIISAIGFFIAETEKFSVQSGQKIDLAATLEKSTFRGANELRLRIVDVKIV